MAITSITIENFKGFREKVKIDLKPITLLFGANSAGKSTIIQSLHYAWEVIGRHNLDPNFTEFGGREMDLGGFENLVHGHDLDKSISLRLDFDLTGHQLPIYGDPEKLMWAQTEEQSFGENELMDFDNIPMLRWNISKNEINTGWIELQVSWSEFFKKIRVSSYEVGLNSKIITKVRISPESDKAQIVYINFFHPLLAMNKDRVAKSCGWLNTLIIEKAIYSDAVWLREDVFSSDQYKRIDKNLNAIEKEWDEIQEFNGKSDVHKLEIKKALEKLSDVELCQKMQEYGFKDTNDWPREAMVALIGSTQYQEKIEQKTQQIKKIEQEETNKILDIFTSYEFFCVCIEVFGIESINDELNIECLGLMDALPLTKGSFKLNFKSKSSEGLLEGIDYYDALDSAIKQFTIGPLEILCDELKKLVYLGPIRCRIPRNYVPNRYVENRNWPDGSAAWDVLHKEDAEFVKQVDHWMADRLKSGYHITQQSYKEIDVSRIEPEQNNLPELYSLAPIKTRLYLMDDKSKIEVQPADVGVGISQVIPVIVSALYFDDGIVSIEQPELHIHPALQVTLGDLFISQIKENCPCFIIETHSEHMLLRLLRRIRETTDNEAPETQTLTPADLAIYFIEQDENGTSCTSIRVNEEGDFMDRWPQGFFAERAKELF